MMTTLLRSSSGRRRIGPLALKAAVGLVAALALFGALSAAPAAPAASALAAPVIAGKGGIIAAMRGMAALWKSKAALVAENESLRAQLADDAGQDALIETLSAELASSVRGFDGLTAPRTLAAVLATPSQSLYDTLLVGAGAADGLETGDIVVSSGGAAIGTVAGVARDTATVLLFSAAGRHTTGSLASHGDQIDVVGMGGSGLEALVPHDLPVPVGEQVMLTSAPGRLLGTVRRTGERPGGSLKVLFIETPANPNELSFVAILRSPTAPSAK